MNELGSEMQYNPFSLRATPTTVKIVGKFTPVCCMQMCVCDRIQHLFSSVCSLCKKTAYCTLIQFDFGYLDMQVSILPFSFEPEWSAPFWKKCQNELLIGETNHCLSLFLYFI